MRSRIRTSSGSGGPPTAEGEYTGAALMPGTSLSWCSLRAHQGSRFQKTTSIPSTHGTEGFRDMCSELKADDPPEFRIVKGRKARAWWWKPRQLHHCERCAH